MGFTTATVITSFAIQRLKVLVNNELSQVLNSPGSRLFFSVTEAGDTTLWLQIHEKHKSTLCIEANFIDLVCSVHQATSARFIQVFSGEWFAAVIPVEDVARSLQCHLGCRDRQLRPDRIGFPKLEAFLMDGNIQAYLDFEDDTAFVVDADGICLSTQEKIRPKHLAIGAHLSTVIPSSCCDRLLAAFSTHGKPVWCRWEEDGDERHRYDATCIATLRDGQPIALVTITRTVI